MTGTAIGLPGMATDDRPAPGVEGSGRGCDAWQVPAVAGGAERREAASASDRSSDGGGGLGTQPKEQRRPGLQAAAGEKRRLRPWSAPRPAERAAAGNRQAKTQPIGEVTACRGISEAAAGCEADCKSRRTPLCAGQRFSQAVKSNSWDCFLIWGLIDN